MLGRTDSKGRLVLLLAFIVALSGGLMLRLAYWQVSERDQLVEVAKAANATKTVTNAVRGTIYDRSGRIVLAQTIFRDRLVADPHLLTSQQRSKIADSLVTLLGSSPSEAATIRSAMASDSKYVVLATGLEADTSHRIREGLADGSLGSVWLEAVPVRVYPQTGGAPHTTLAAQMLGFVNSDGHGQYGVEQRYDAVLAGRPQVVVTDPTRPGDDATYVQDPGEPGADIRLTIDAGVQLALEQEVFGAWMADKAKSVSGVVMDPATGEILGEATYPSYDANQYQEIAATNPSLFRDPVIADPYEPGSVFKMLTASAALESGTTSLTTKINDTGLLTVSGGQIQDADRRPMGWRTFADIVAYSRNVGATQVAMRLGKTTGSAAQVLYGTWQNYGIGQPTGVDLAGEQTGTARDPSSSKWREIDLANASFGQGVAATQLQVLRAYTAMANGGYLVQPHVVGPSDRAGSQPATSRRIVDPNLSTSLTWLMRHVVESVSYYKKGTLIPGYVVGGKTGTAQIWDPTLNDGRGGWKEDLYNHSFYGFVGRTGPELMIGLVIREATPTHIAQGVIDLPIQSYQLFRRIALDSMRALGRTPLDSAPLAPSTPPQFSASPLPSAASPASPATSPGP